MFLNNETHPLPAGSSNPGFAESGAPPEMPGQLPPSPEADPLAVVRGFWLGNDPGAAQQFLDRRRKTLGTQDPWEGLYPYIQGQVPSATAANQAALPLQAPSDVLPAAAGSVKSETGRHRGHSILKDLGRTILNKVVSPPAARHAAPRPARRFRLALGV